MESKLYLAHYGILGQKWGVQNGPPYPLSGSQKSSSEKRAKKGPSGISGDKFKNSNNNSGRWFKANIKGGKDKPNVSPAERVTKETKNIVGNAENIINTINKSKPKTTSEKAKSMSDKELRDAINRIQMERQYDSLTSEETRNGWEISKDVLSVVGDVLGAAVSGIIITATIKELLGK